VRIFDSRMAAGVELAPLVQAALGRDPAQAPGDVLVLGVAPHGLGVAEPVAASLGVSVHPVTITETPDGLSIGPLPPVASCTVVVVVDDGVETGTAARAIAGALEPLGPARRVLAVPVCPHQALATLQLVYDAVIAIDRPLARRSLRWHYAEGVH
jgi:predicted phosphoribosyltransferase